MPELLNPPPRVSPVIPAARGGLKPLMGIAYGLEFFYAAAVSLRNRMFDAGLRKSRRLPRPVISIGNITTGGTGKTPMIRWLAERLREEGSKICILSRGYKARRGELGDELTMLGQQLNGPSTSPVELRANPNRFDAGDDAIRTTPAIDLFLLDDGFQHRMLARDLDIVLISAVSPFGFDHVLPAGLLREPLRGLRRAGSFIISRADQVTEDELAKTELTLRRFNSTAPIFRAAHTLRGFRSARTAASAIPDISLNSMVGKKWMAFCGIADPGSFVRPIASFANQPVNVVSYGDHHQYSESDLLDLRRKAAECGAETLVTTEKDWVKLARFPLAFDEKLPIWRTEMEIEFLGDGQAKLLDFVRECLRNARRSP